MAATPRSSSGGAGTSSNSPVAATEPTGTVQNDVIFGQFIVEATGVTAIALPSGWTSLRNGNNADFYWRWGYIVRGASAPSLSFSWTGTTNRYREVFLVTVQGADTTNPIDASATAVATGTNNSANPPSVDPVSADALAMVFMAHWSGSGAGGWTPPTGYTIRSNNTAGNDALIATKALASGSVEDPAAITAPGSANWVADTFAIAAAAAGSAPTNSVAPAVTGTAQDGQTLTCSQGTWTNSPTGYAYQWKRAGTNISGATSSTYLLVTADVGQAVKCTVTATNAIGSASADSNTVTPIAASTDTNDCFVMTAGGLVATTSHVMTNTGLYPAA